MVAVSPSPFLRLADGRDSPLFFPFFSLPPFEERLSFSFTDMERLHPPPFLREGHHLPFFLAGPRLFPPVTGEAQPFLHKEKYLPLFFLARVSLMKYVLFLVHTPRVFFLHEGDWQRIPFGRSSNVSFFFRFT